MDPNSNLADQLRLAKFLLDDNPGNSVRAHAGAAVRLAELVESLNDWIKGGGFLPDAWRRA